MFDAMIPIIGLILLIAGFIAWVYWQVRFLVVVYKYSRWWFFGCLFVPFVDWVFVSLHFKMAWKPFGLSWLGFILAILGKWMFEVVRQKSA